jgi:hypothetical protein
MPVFPPLTHHWNELSTCHLFDEHLDGSMGSRSKIGRSISKVCAHRETDNPNLPFSFFFLFFKQNFPFSFDTSVWDGTNAAFPPFLPLHPLNHRHA